jgi:hypothetical protein
MVSSVPEPQVNIAQFLKKNLIARSKSNRGFGRDDRRCAWLLVGATRKRRTCECAICDSTETIYSANQTSQIAASPSSGLRGSPVPPCRTHFGRLILPKT